jgi:hypothetical protein
VRCQPLAFPPPEQAPVSALPVGARAAFRLPVTLGPDLPPGAVVSAAALERRLATFEEDRDRAVGWDELKAELARRCP